MISLCQYHKLNTAVDGGQSACKKCHAERQRLVRQQGKYKERRKAYQREYYKTLLVGSKTWWKRKTGGRGVYAGMKWMELKAIYEKDPNCHYCGVAVPLPDVVFDHKIPRSKGGASNRINVVTCCRLCNRLKWDMMPDEFLSILRTYAQQVVGNYAVSLVKKRGKHAG